jgi:retron-type reverse transcriptase
MVSDRIAQTVVKLMIEPILDSGFHPDSYGYAVKLPAQAWFLELFAQFGPHIWRRLRRFKEARGWTKPWAFESNIELSC